MTDHGSRRHLGLWGATGVGVGAIVGGGILALAGVAFATTGPSAMLAFALNGAIAALTAASFAALCRAFPESGGPYAFARRVVSVEIAFMVGWVVWFASVVAAVLYALGFSAFALLAVERVWAAFGAPPAWLAARPLLVGLAAAAVLAYAAQLARAPAGGGQWATVGKVAVFGLLIVTGLWALAGRPVSEVRADLTPFFTEGFAGLVQAMGYTFIALQGFDLIAAVGGEVRRPRQNLPRAMYLSLAIALAIYLPLLLVIATVGTAPGESIAALAAREPEGVVAVAAERFLGPVGYWLVLVAAVLSMLSALQANLYGASRVAFAMARDRALPPRLARRRRGVPIHAVALTAALVLGILAVLPDVAAAGAASSLIFLVSFAIVHWLASLLRARGGAAGAPAGGASEAPSRSLVQAVGAAACLGLAAFQGFAVPEAGALASVWLGVGVALFFLLFAARARVADASAEALDPDLVRLRGRSPLVLVPVANPGTAPSLVSAARALAAPRVGRVLLLSVVRPPSEGAPPPPLDDVQAVVRESLAASFEGRLAPQVLVAVADDPWAEIARAARLHRCEALLLGLGRLDDPSSASRVERLLAGVEADLVVLRAPARWRLEEARRVLVPVGGRRDHSPLRARLLASLSRTGEREIRFVRVVAPSTPRATVRRIERELEALAVDEAPFGASVEVLTAEDALGTLVELARGADLVVLGMRRETARRKTFGELPTELARRTDRPLLLVSRGG